MCLVIRWICKYIRYFRFYLLKPYQLRFGFLVREGLIEISPSVHFLHNVPGDCSSLYNRIKRFRFVYQSFQYVGRSPHRPVREFMRTLTRTTKGRRLLVYLTINLIATGKKLIALKFRYNRVIESHRSEPVRQYILKIKIDVKNSELSPFSRWGQLKISNLNV